MQIQTGEIYGKQTAAKLVMYNVLKVTKAKGAIDEIITLQNIDNPLSLFETTAQKLASSGYFDFLEERADSQKPAPILPDLFSPN